MRSPYALDEQETVINMVPKAVSGTAQIYSCVPAMMKRLARIAKEHPGEVTITDGDGFVDASVPADWIKVTPKRKSTMTEEQRRAAAERIAAYRKAKEANQT